MDGVRPVSNILSTMMHCDAHKETLISFGVKQERSELNLFLVRLAKKLTSLRDNVRRDRSGARLFDPSFDPYRCSFIGPDYLVTRLALNCIELSLFCYILLRCGSITSSYVCKVLTCSDFVTKIVSLTILRTCS